MKRFLATLPLILLCLACQRGAAPVQRGEDFNFDWRFTLGDEPAFAETGFDDAA